MALKPSSAQAWKLLARVKDGLNDVKGAQAAWAKADGILQRT